MIDHLTNLLAQIASRYPDCWETVESLRFSHEESSRHWPAYCFVPLGFAVGIVTSGKSWTGEEILERGADVARLGALSAWRATQRIYEFDPALLKELNATPLSNAPFEIFRQLPDWCVYIPFPNEALRGCFVHVETSDRAEDELRFLFDFGDGLDSLVPLTIHSFEGTVKDCFESGSEEVARELRYINMRNGQAHESLKRDSNYLPVVLNQMRQVISQALYLCSADADCSKSTFTAENKIKWGFSSSVPTNPQEIPVGRVVGVRLSNASKTDTNGNSVHLANACWQHGWTDFKEKTGLSLKWESPLLSNLEKILPAGKSGEGRD